MLRLSGSILRARVRWLPVSVDAVTPEPEAPGSAAARRHVWLAALRHLALVAGHVWEAEQSQQQALLERELPGAAMETMCRPGDAALRHRLGVGSPLAAEDFPRFRGLCVLAGEAPVAVADGATATGPTTGEEAAGAAKRLHGGRS